MFSAIVKFLLILLLAYVIIKIGPALVSFFLAAVIICVGAWLIKGLLK